MFSWAGDPETHSGWSSRSKKGVAMDVQKQDNLGVDVIFRPANPLDTPGALVPPLQPGTTVLPKGSVHAESGMALPCDVRMDRDVAVTLRDGTVIYGDIYRPTGDEQVPVILVWTPYGKYGGWWNLHMKPTVFGVSPKDVSGLQAFEAPDPAYWCSHGYAVAVVDVRGTARSGGDMLWWGRAGGRDVYDTVEWLAEQEWCSGKVGMAGNSQLTILQWFGAAERPPHLAAIAPWEGCVDMYREDMGRGGIPETKFHSEDVAAFLYGENRFEDPAAMLTEHPLMNAYWADKRARLDQIEAPAYIVASWTHPIHCHGTLQAFREISSTDKWLRVSNELEWVDLADPDNVADLRRFFDRYLKGIDNDWEDTPRVRLSVLDPGGTDQVGRPENEWPLARQEWRTLYLNPADGTLSEELPAHEAVARYQGDDPASSVTFTCTFDEDTEITGHLNLHLWVEAEAANDMDLFAAVYKTDSDGNRLHHVEVRSPEMRAVVLSMETDGRLPAGFGYEGPSGRLRVSHRALDPERSTPSEPYLTHAEEQLLTPGECVPVELALWPTSLLVHAGERLIVEIAGHPVGNVSVPPMPGPDPDVPTRNKGAHLIRTGGTYDSHLLLPVVPTTAPRG
ncbi:CocE/NonD family hydrolase [Streptomyces spongiae]|uniref:CocE/NonD family hydrolase n=2 Tax=Streptomyces spongiae TaxID=565072 RepID=A0A5N8X9B7_9ACTN|nr:CocE/NonD family hydrolase [Streptomyces spongiae]